jgi:hypothetical protein
MNSNQKASLIFREYKRKTENEIGLYNNLKTIFPYVDFPKHARRVWRVAILAEIWGIMATKLSGGTINYLDEWRRGG